MKRFFVMAVFVLLVLGLGMINAVFADSSDSWNITVTTGPDSRTIVPLNSTGLLSLENFTISSCGQVSSLSYNSSISELCFKVNVSASDASVSGTNMNVTLPVSIVENSSLVLNVNVDGKGNGYMLFQPSTLGFYLYQGSHTVTVDIGADPPTATIPEFSTLTLTLFLLLSLFAVGMMKRKRACSLFSTR